MLTTSRSSDGSRRYAPEINQRIRPHLNWRLSFTAGIDKHASYPEAFAASVEEKVLPADRKVRRVKYLNNVIGQGH